MEASEPQVPSPALSRAREEVWERLWSQLDLSEGFWLGFLAGSDLAWIEELQRRSEQILPRQARGMEVHDVADPAHLREVVPWLLAPREASVGLTWVVGVSGDPRPWTQAWTWVLHRLNERRDVLARTLPGGLVLVGPPVLRQLVRDEATDLWTQRSLMLDVPPPVGGDSVVAEAATAYTPSAVLEEDTRLFVERASKPAVTPSEPVGALLQRAGRHMQAGRGDLAVPAAREALDRAAGPDDQALAHARLALAYQLRGDGGAALSHAERALGLARPLGHRITVDLLDILVDSLDPPRARHAAALRVAVARRRLETTDSHQALSDLIVARGIEGDLAQRVGDLDHAEAAYTEVLGVARQAAERFGESLQGLRDVSVPLERLGDVLVTRGDVAGAERMFREALDLDRGLVERFGESPQGLRDVSVSLIKVGEVLVARGDVAGAEALFGESLALARRLVERFGESPEGLRDVSVSLIKVGDVLVARGDVAGAEALFREALDLHRRLVERFGESPEGLRDLSVSLNKVGDVLVAQGDVAGAEALFGEALGRRRRLVERFGESPEGLRDVSVSLTRVGDVLVARGDVAGAEAAFREALDLDRRLVERFGESPQALRDVSVSLNKVGSVSVRRGDVAGSEALFRESSVLARRVLERFGESPQALRDLSVSLTKVGNVFARRGDVAGAEAAFREALDLQRRLAERYGEPHADPDVLADLERRLQQLPPATEPRADRGDSDRDAV